MYIFANIDKKLKNMQSKFHRSFLFLLLFFCFIVSKADNPTLHFIGLKLKSGDTLRHITIFNRFSWDVRTFKGSKELLHYQRCSPDSVDLDNADKIELKTSFEVDSNLLYKTFVFHSINKSSLFVRINGNEIIKIIKPLKIKRFVLLDEEEEQYYYFSFPQKKVTIEISIINSDLSKAFEGKFEIGTLQWKDERIHAEGTRDKNSISISFYYLAIGIILLILFLFYKKSIENFYFAFFCILFSFSYASGLLPLSSFVGSLFSSLTAYSLNFLASYLSIILTGKVRSKIPVVIFSIVIGTLMLIQTVFQYYKVSTFIVFASIFYLIYNFCICVYLLFQGGSKKKWEVKFITYGFFTALFFIIGISFIVIMLSQSNPNFDFTKSLIFAYSYIIGLLIIPLTIAVIIGKRNGLNQKELTEQLSEIKILSEQNIQKEKEKQVILSEQNTLLEEKVKARTTDLQHQKEIVEEKNREILDSIEYALRIQTAILPPSRIVKQYLINSFILYKPKDIVAGDFYWMETIGDLVLFAACDCTGHGVSGAMVSLVCHNALNRAVREFNLEQPASILNKTSEIVVENFAKSEAEIKDGMDISICAYNTKTKTLDWAGANNPLWLIKDGEFIEIKADKQPIGMDENNHPFTNHQITLNTGDSIYIFSDGFADQFGGQQQPASLSNQAIQGKEIKLTRRRFKDLILSIQTSPLQEQGTVLEKFIVDYRRDIEQTDDILVIGVRI